MNNLNNIIGLFIALSLLYRGKIQGQYATDRFIISQVLSTTPTVHTSREIEQVHLRDPARLAEYSTQTPGLHLAAQRNVGQSRRLSTSHKTNRPSNEPVKVNNKKYGSNVTPAKSEEVYDKVNFDNDKTSAKQQSNSKGNVTVVETPEVGGNATTANGTVVTFDERSNFDGDQCPTGYVKINGKCVERDD